MLNWLKPAADGTTLRILLNMATISHSDLAPDEKVHYSLAAVEFDLAGTETYETDDEEVLRNAGVNPWLKVEFPVEDPNLDTQVAVVEFPHTAIDASLPQTEQHFEGGGDAPIAETLAADEAQGDEPIVVDSATDTTDVSE